MFLDPSWQLARSLRGTHAAAGAIGDVRQWRLKQLWDVRLGSSSQNWVHQIGWLKHLGFPSNCKCLVTSRDAMFQVNSGPVDLTIGIVWKQLMTCDLFKLYSDHGWHYFWENRRINTRNLGENRDVVILPTFQRWCDFLFKDYIQKNNGGSDVFFKEWRKTGESTLLNWCKVLCCFAFETKAKTWWSHPLLLFQIRAFAQFFPWKVTFSVKCADTRVGLHVRVVGRAGRVLLRGGDEVSEKWFGWSFWLEEKLEDFLEDLRNEKYVLDCFRAGFKAVGRAMKAWLFQKHQQVHAIRVALFCQLRGPRGKPRCVWERNEMNQSKLATATTLRFAFLLTVAVLYIYIYMMKFERSASCQPQESAVSKLGITCLLETPEIQENDKITTWTPQLLLSLETLEIPRNNYNSTLQAKSKRHQNPTKLIDHEAVKSTIV